MRGVSVRKCFSERGKTGGVGKISGKTRGEADEKGERAELAISVCASFSEPVEEKWGMGRV